MNHNPLDFGDNLPTLTNHGTVTLPGGKSTTQETTTWWGFPTWRETLSPYWTDPTVQVNVGMVSLAAGAGVARNNLRS